MDEQYIRVASFSQQTLIDISIALINDIGLKEDVDYLIRTNKTDSKFSLELLAEGKHLRTVILVLSPSQVVLSVDAMQIINKQAERMFREDSSYGVKDATGIERIIGSIHNGYGNVEFFPGIIKKVTAYWFKFATSQMFHNGNKRTALLSALYFLFLSGFSWRDIDGNELYEMTVDIANKKVSQNDLEDYIRRKVGLQYFNSLSQARDFDSVHFTLHFTIDKPRT